MQWFLHLFSALISPRAQTTNDKVQCGKKKSARETYDRPQNGPHNAHINLTMEHVALDSGICCTAAGGLGRGWQRERDTRPGSAIYCFEFEIKQPKVAIKGCPAMAKNKPNGGSLKRLFRLSTFSSFVCLQPRLVAPC